MKVCLISKGGGAMSAKKKETENPNVVRRSLQEIVGNGYADFWHFKGLEVFLMGGKGRF